MTRLRDLPIRQKLMVLIIVTTTLGLLLAGAGIISADSVLFHRYLSRDLITFAQVIADNSTASLAFDDRQSAQDLLAALRVRTHIVGACLMAADGSIFAEYVRSGEKQQCAAQANGADTRLAFFKTLTVMRPVNLRERLIGSLIITSDLGEVADRAQIYGLTVLAVTIVSILLVVLLSSKLRTLFVTPILKLAATTALVSDTKDYKVRAAQLSSDEVGKLSGAFNEMLAGIESRDADLRQTLTEREEALRRLAEVNRDMQRSNDELARSNHRDLERFAFIASHDMQEPLRNVTIYSQLLVRDASDSSSKASMYCDFIVEGANRMRALIADLLAYVEITTGPARMNTVDLNAAMEKVKLNLRASIDETLAEVTCTSLPHLEAHEAHIVSLFQNLISNSIKYRGSEAPKIQISSEEVDGSYRFAVTDNGIGIAPEYHQQIFAAFKRLHGKNVPGTGIGLAICQRIVERYGGRIWVESADGKGATFKFTFPKAAAAAAGEGR